METFTIDCTSRGHARACTIENNERKKGKGFAQNRSWNFHGSFG